MKYFYQVTLRTCVLALLMCVFHDSSLAQVSINGELKKWHTITLDIEGPFSQENGPTNPFLDYRLFATFRHLSGETIVPGYFAADGNSANSGATSGNIWRVHFTPPYEGNWTYTLQFVMGDRVATKLDSNIGTSLQLDQFTGAFTVGPSDKSGKDFRGKGRLIWDNSHYWKFQGSDNYFIKGGTDSPESFFGCTDFDNTQGPKTHDWGKHEQDWQEKDPTWKNGLGKGIIGAINYLASKGLNSVGPITMAIKGDVQGIFPFISAEERDRFDCSKLDQWQIVVDHAQKQGIHIQFKLSENENYDLEGTSLGDLHKVYYREMVARFGHFLGISWNIGEEFGESNQPYNQFARDLANYLDEINPYAQNITIHNWGGREQDVFIPQMGQASSFTGTSLQGEYYRAHSMALDMREASAAKGKAWIIAHDEQPPVNAGLPPDGMDASSPASPNEGPFSQEEVRKKGLWGHLMAGGAGMEWFWGVDWPNNQTDFEGNDYRSRDQFWNYVNHALTFFQEYLPFEEMEPSDELIGNSNHSNEKYCLAKANEIYAIYLPEGGSTELDLREANGEFEVSWYNPRVGGNLITNNSLTLEGGRTLTSIGEAPSKEDWVALIQRKKASSADISIAITQPSTLSQFKPGQEIEIRAEIRSGGEFVKNVSLLLGKFPFTYFTEPPYSHVLRDLPQGTYEFTARATDFNGNTILSDPIEITISPNANEPEEEEEQEDKEQEEEEEALKECDAPFIEKNGIIVIEAENTTLTDGWEERNDISGFSGEGFIEYVDQNRLDDPGYSVLEYKFQIDSPGTYRFDYHTKVGYGIDPSEHNDTWVRFPDADNFFGELDGKIAYPDGVGKSPIFKGSTADGWGKAYSWGTTDWTFRTKVSDLEGLHLHATFNEAGIYTLQLSGRSKGHFVDRLILYQKDKATEEVWDLSINETSCAASNPSVNVKLPNDKTTFFEGNDIPVLANISGINRSEIEKVEFFRNSEIFGEASDFPYQANWFDAFPGTHLIAVIVTDSKGRTYTSEGVEISVLASSDVHDIPGSIESESYQDMSDIGITANTNGDQFIWWDDENDWTEYRINALQSGTFSLAAIGFSTNSTAECEVLIDDVPIGRLQFSATSTANEPKEYHLADISINEGIHFLKMRAIHAPFHIDQMTFSLDSLDITQDDRSVDPAHATIRLLLPGDGITTNPVVLSWKVDDTITNEIESFDLQINDEILSLANIQSHTLNLLTGSYLCRIRARLTHSVTSWSAPIAFWIP